MTKIKKEAIAQAKEEVKNCVGLDRWPTSSKEISPCELKRAEVYAKKVAAAMGVPLDQQLRNSLLSPLERYAIEERNAAKADDVWVFGLGWVSPSELDKAKAEEESAR
ncbi:hypothetical protein EV05_0014 [Prochlorococcus sp. MIT 0601]|nr:hypothetical protein EV05_0014 [Prochlorococcus sp. MIT 0601]